MKFRYVFLLAVLLSVVVVPGALAAAAPIVPGPGTPAPQPDGPVAVGVNIWLVAISLLTTLVTYVLNYFGPAVSEQAKGVVMILTNAAAACLYQLLSDGSLGFNQQTAVALITAVGTAAFAHGLLFKPAGIAHALGAGQNKNGEPVVQKTIVGS